MVVELDSPDSTTSYDCPDHDGIFQTSAAADRKEGCQIPGVLFR